MAPNLFLGTEDYHVGPWMPLMCFLPPADRKALRATTGRTWTRFKMIESVTGRHMDGSLQVDPITGLCKRIQYELLHFLVETEPAYRSWLDASVAFIAQSQKACSREATERAATAGKRARTDTTCPLRTHGDWQR